MGQFTSAIEYKLSITKNSDNYLAFKRWIGGFPLTNGMNCIHDSLKKRHKWLIFRKIKVFYATAYID